VQVQLPGAANCRLALEDTAFRGVRYKRLVPKRIQLRQYRGGFQRGHSRNRGLIRPLVWLCLKEDSDGRQVH